MVHLWVASGTSLLLVLAASEKLVRGATLRSDHHLGSLDLGADATHLLRLTAEVPELAAWLEIVLEPAKRLTHLLLVFCRLFDLFRGNLRALTLTVPRGVWVALVSIGSMASVNILLVVLSSVHYNGLWL